MTALGRNGRSLAGMPLLTRACHDTPAGRDDPFVSRELQSFSHRDDRRIELVGTGLCLAVGEQSDTTFSPDHRWRSLFLAPCETVPPERSAWAPHRRN